MLIYQGIVFNSPHLLAALSLLLLLFSGKKSCHTGIMKSSGWVVPVGHLIDRGEIDVKGCDIPVAVSK